MDILYAILSIIFWILVVIGLAVFLEWSISIALGLGVVGVLFIIGLFVVLF